MSHFDTNPKSLKDLLSQIQMGELALPDFQRDFVWDPGATEELIESIMRKYPAGSLLFLKHDGAGFQVREFQGAPKPKATTGVSYLVLDGQQRMTSLYQAFYGKGDHRFFLDIGAFIKNSDIEEAVWHETLKRCERNGLLNIEDQTEHLICPLSTVFGKQGGFHSWIDEVMERRAEKDDEARALRNQLRDIHDKWILPVSEYHFPVITLGANTELDAVCKMFETLNRRGVKLTVFELLMARAFANQVSLRQLWDEAKTEFKEFEEFDIDPYYVLQIVSLLKANTIKRSDVLKLEPKAIYDSWKSAIAALGATLRYARSDLGILSGGYLPYNTMLVPMAALWTRISELKGPVIASAKEKISQWFWASVFSQAYEQGPSSRAVRDLKELTSWIFENGSEPRAFRTLAFSPAHFCEVTPKQRALYRGTLALIVSNGAKDFHKGDTLSYEYLINSNVDDHHIFPQNFLRKKKVTDSKVNCVLNRTLIDRSTNIRISDNAPSKYLREIKKELGDKSYRQLFDSHFIPVEPLENDAFEDFLDARAKLLFDALKTKIKRDVPEAALPEEEDEDGDEDDELGVRNRIDPALMNIHPEEFLKDQPEWVERQFNALTATLRTLNPDIWWKVKKGSISFFSPQKHFLNVTISKSGLRLTLFTRDKPIEGVEPIVHKGFGGKLWGRIRVEKDTDFSKIGDTLKRSLSEMKDALEAGEATAWWAYANKMRSEGKSE